MRKRIESYVERHPRFTTNVLIAGASAVGIAIVAHAAGYKFVRVDGFTEAGQPVLHELFGTNYTVVPDK